MTNPLTNPLTDLPTDTVAVCSNMTNRADKAAFGSLLPLFLKEMAFLETAYRATLENMDRVLQEWGTFEGGGRACGTRDAGMVGPWLGYRYR